MRSSKCLLASLFFLAALSTATAGGLAVQPVRLFMDAGRTTESIQVRNESALPLPLQLRAYEWRQDDRGKDIYQQTGDLIFFPRMMTLAPGEQRIVRVGVRGMAPEGEHSYRLYIEELPDPASAPAKGLRTLLRIGVPVFRRPASLEFAGQLVDLELQDCRISFSVANQGNAHLMLQGVTVSAFDRVGRLLMTDDLKGWYVLAERERPFTHQLPEEICAEARSLKVRVTSDQASFEEVADVSF